MENRFIPGDWIQYGDKIVKIYAKIHDMSQDGVNYIKIAGEAVYPRESLINGIPLTQKILEKNGWKRCENPRVYELLDDIDKLPLLTLFHIDKSFDVFINDSEINITPIVWLNIKYVHQLQHLLFGLGINSDMEV